MGVNIVEVSSKAKAWLQSRGRIGHVQLGEPKAPPQNEISVAVLMDRVTTPESVLDAATHLYELRMRFYRGAFEDGEATEIEMAEVIGAVMTDIEGTTSLGEYVRNVDVAGQYSNGLEAEWRYLEIEQTPYRVVDLSVPIIVDGEPGSLVNQGGA